MEVRRLPGWSETNRTDELYHHGIKGQRWGIRRYQNSDGSLTGAGRKRLGYSERREIKRQEKIKKKTQKLQNRYAKEVEDWKNATAYAEQYNQKAIRMKRLDAVDPFYVQQSSKAYKNALDTYYNTKISALTDKTAKGSKAYKQARRYLGNYQQAYSGGGYVVVNGLGTSMHVVAQDINRANKRANKRIVKARKTGDINKVSRAIEKSNKRIGKYGMRVSGIGESNGTPYVEFENTLNKKPNNGVEVNFVKKRKK